MTQKDVIRQEIERRIAGSDDAYARALRGILSFIDSLPEEHLRDSTKMISEDLEEAAERAARKVYPYEGGMKGIICETSIPIFKAGFIVGAEWQKQETGRGYDSRDLYEAYEQGRFEQKEQMLKEAVEGEVVQDLHGKLHVKTNAVSDILYQFGDKVKVIIVKK